MQLVTKLDTEMFQNESYKPIYFGVKGQGHESQKHCRRWSLHSCECWLLLVCVVAVSAGMSGRGEASPRLVGARTRWYRDARLQRVEQSLATDV